ncbi:hypothetical protein FRC10_009956, partial [Ceratobasidium sp. 414]
MDAIAFVQGCDFVLFLQIGEIREQNVENEPGSQMISKQRWKARRLRIPDWDVCDKHPCPLACAASNFFMNVREGDIEGVDFDVASIMRE